MLGVERRVDILHRSIRIVTEGELSIHKFIPSAKICVDNTRAVINLRPRMILKADDRKRIEIPALADDNNQGCTGRVRDDMNLDFVEQLQAVNTVDVVCHRFPCKQ